MFDLLHEGLSANRSRPQRNHGDVLILQLYLNLVCIFIRIDNFKLTFGQTLKAEGYLTDTAHGDHDLLYKGISRNLPG